MATVTNWIDHLNKPAEEVVGAVYPGAGSVEGYACYHWYYFMGWLACFDCKI